MGEDSSWNRHNPPSKAVLLRPSLALVMLTEKAMERLHPAREKQRLGLLNRDGLREIPRAIDLPSQSQGRLVREKLKGQYRDQGTQQVAGFGH